MLTWPFSAVSAWREREGERKRKIEREGKRKRGIERDREREIE